MAIALGEDCLLLFFYGGAWVPISCARAATLVTESELINVSNTQSGKWSDFRAKRINGRLDFDGLTAINEDFTPFDLRSLQFDLRTVDVVMQVIDRQGQNVTYQFSALAQSISETISYQDAATFSSALQISGAITLLTNFTPTGGSIMRLQTIASGGEVSFTFTSLISKNILSVARDGLEYYNSGVNPPDVNKEFQYVSATGQINFNANLPFSQGEQLIILYQ